ncbi:MAG: protein kinase [Polyangiales bacterium]
MSHPSYRPERDALTPLPTPDAQRLAALASCGVLDGEAELLFDKIAHLAAQVCGAPMAQVYLVGQGQGWFKQRVGLSESHHVQDLGRAFLSHAIAANAPVLVADARLDPRLADHPFVTGEPFVRFYASVPVTIDDQLSVGALCVFDREPHAVTDIELAALRSLAREVERTLDDRRRLASSPPPEAAATCAASAPTVVGVVTPTGAVSLHRHDPRLPLPVGSVVGDRYRTGGAIGVGGMGVVVRGSDLDTGEPVAIKFMQPEAVSRPEALQRFVREAQALLLIESPHVARVRDVGNLDNGVPYIVMEYLEGEDLSARLGAGERFTLRGAVELVLEACVAVESAHAQGVLHRDLKPANLFLARCADGERRVKVLDFGISKFDSPGLRAPDASITTSAVLIGSPNYMAPEQMLDAVTVDARADVWSLGVILYELLTGRLPFSGRTLTEVCSKVLTAPAPPLSEHRPEAPPILQRLIDRCLAKERDERYESAAELSAALRTVLTAVDLDDRVTAA